MATLCQMGEDGSIAGQWKLGEQPLVLGRDETTDAHVEDGSASRRHSVIMLESGHYVIEDLGSQNGTWVDGRRVLVVRLYHNAHILVGRTQFVFLDHEPSAVTVVQTPRPSPGPDAPIRPDRPAFPPALSRSGPGLGRQA